MANPQHPQEHSVIETFQSLIVAFVLAMTFRGFVTEGFVIPTGSMAPTLMGRHFLAESPQTGSVFRMDARNARSRGANLNAVPDPMVGPNGYVDAGTQRVRMGDRILVLKCLYPFSMPDRWDVVVFKNPTDPLGEAGNYIKRLIGLPDESILLIDGDVFHAPREQADDLSAYRVARKPEHVQRAVWQPIANSDLIPLDPSDLPSSRGDGADGRMPLWVGDGWDTTGRVFVSETADASVLRWNARERQINDWAVYNALIRRGAPFRNVSDLRVTGSIRAEQDGLTSTFDLQTRNHQFQFVIGDGTATARMRLADESGPWTEQSATLPTFPAGEVVNVEFWHVDQALSLFVDGERVAYLEYEWAPVERLQFSRDEESEDFDRLVMRSGLPPAIHWQFEGSPATLSRVRLDRDLHYRPGAYGRGRNHPVAEQHEHLVVDNSHGYGTHPDKPAILGPDHFYMCGDNSAESLDSRLWGAPHPLIREQIDDMPFVVNRRLLLGKAWVVYFPAPYGWSDLGRAFIPDFGRLRFIR